MDRADYLDAIRVLVSWKLSKKRVSGIIIWSTSYACHEIPLSEMKKAGSACSTRSSGRKDFNQYWMHNLTQRRSCATQNLSQWSTSDKIDQTWFLKGYDTAITTDKKCKERQWIPLHSKPVEKFYLSSASSSFKNTENQGTMAVSGACDYGFKGLRFDPRPTPPLWSKSRNLCTDRIKKKTYASLWYNTCFRSYNHWWQK